MEGLLATCPHCDHVFQVKCLETDGLGEFVTCPECSGTFDADSNVTGTNR